MASMKVIKKRIFSVQSTKKIMKAMNLVAASKLQKVKSRLDGIRPMFENLTTVMDAIKAGLGSEYDLIFTEKREVKNIAYIVLTGDRGLCGGYNINVSKEALACIESNKGKQEKIIALGSKGADYFRRRNKEIIQRSACASEACAFLDAEALANYVTSLYTSKKVDEVYIIYTHFDSILAHVPHIVRLLPLRTNTSDSGAESGYASLPMIYDPDVETFIDQTVPMFLSISIYSAMLESTVCELASRMTSMDSATRNAEEIIEDLTLEFNRKRQGLITQEITEIVSGANAIQ